jgi:pyruvate dehydrogenase E2 component (dihydrolipoamide acetyltransferase)
MPTNVIMPQMGESIFEGTVTKWLKKLGDPVVRDEPLFEISTDKVDAEIPSPSGGVLTSMLVKEGETVQINTVVAVLDGEMGAGAAPSAAPAAAGPAAAAPVAATTKIAVDPEPAPAGSPSEAVASEEAASSESGDDQIRSSPLVRKLAKEHNVDLSQVTGSGSGGRISKQDILDFVANGGKSTKAAKPAVAKAAAPAPPPPPAAPKPAASIFTAPPLSATSSAPAAKPAAAPATPSPMPVFSGPTRVEPMTNMRAKIAERMVESKHTAPHVATVFQVDMTHVSKLRDKAKHEFHRQHGLKLTYTPFLIRAAADALAAYPIVNSSVDGNNIVYKRDINIGIAVALDWGLIVPVIMHCEEKSFLGVARSISDLAERARNKKLLPDELANGTFTVTNPGNYGAMFATPIINLPQVAIMGVGNIHKAPVVVTDEHGDSLAIRTIAHLTLSFDHRVIDGAVADQFMAHVKKTLENWTEAL